MTTMSPQSAKQFRVESLLVSILVLIVSLGVSFYAISKEQTYRENVLRNQVTRHAIDFSARLQAAINANVFLTNGLVAYIVAHPTNYQPSIDKILSALHGLSPHLRNVAIAPNNRITHVFPIQGNEAALGLYYPDIPSQWPSVQDAIHLRATVIAGPIQLIQGGSGLVSRTPVYLDDGRYWGMVSQVINTEQLFATVFQPTQDDQIQFAIRGKNGKGAKGAPVYGDPGLFQDDSVKTDISIPGGSWQLAALPKNGWQANRSSLIFWKTLALAVSLLLAVGTYLLQLQRLRTVFSEERLRMFLDNTHDGMIVIDSKNTIQEFNPAAERLFGYTAKELIGNHLNSLFSPCSCTIQECTALTGTNHTPSSVQHLTIRHKEGHEVAIEVTMVKAELKNEAHHIGVIRDITERQKMEKRLQELANRDGLTGALNRRAFLEYADRQFKLSQRNQHPMTVLMMDLDHFKRINDTHGHQAGDKVLIHTVLQLEDCLRETDTFGRFGGEEFIAILPETDLSKAIEVIERILHTFRAHKADLGDGTLVPMTISIGAAEEQLGDLNMEETIQRADKALYHAKATGRDRYVLYQDDEFQSP